MSALTLVKRPDGVALITLDTPGSPVNVLSVAFFGEFRHMLEAIEQDPAVRAVVIASAKRDSFIAGADLKDLMAIGRPEDAEALSRDGHALLDRLASSPKPVVAAIHGPALGGGLELALACHYRLATNDPKTVLALPEVQLGLLPGAGGTQRLPRLIGLERALPMLLTGERVRAARALKDGLVDALTTPLGLVETAALAALALADGSLRVARGPRKARAKLMGLGPVRALVFAKARAGVLAKTRGLYPAPEAILRCVEAGLNEGLKAGQAVEMREFGRLVASAEAKHLIWLFNAMNELKKPSYAAAPRTVTRLAVLGAGLMGEGIAAVSLPLGSVVLRDLADESLARAAKSLHASLLKRVRSGSLRNVDKDRQWARLHFTKDLAQLKGSDLVIEAVFEQLALKQRVLAEVEATVAPEAVFASNTSALPIRAIAANALHPERVLGMHYFSPVPKMPLLEIVVAPETAPWALATARAFGIAQGKTTIVVQDDPGFYTTRILAPFMGEALRLLEEGAEVAALDDALKDFGFPVGPVTLVDEVGIDVGAHVARDLGEAFAHRGLAGSNTLERLVDAGLLGRKNGRGFYLYPPTNSASAKEVNSSVYAYLGGVQRQALAAADMVDRLVLLMINEALFCLQEGVIASARDGDVGAILGLGFPPFRGGPFHEVDARGARSVVTRLRELAGVHGPRFEPAPLLVDMAETGKQFYEPSRDLQIQ